MYIKSSIWSGFEIKNWIEDQLQSSPKLVGIWTVLRCIFVPNVEIVTSIGGGLWHGQVQNGVNFDFGVQFDLEGQGQLSHKTIGISTKLFCTSGPNLVILARTVDELLQRQTWWQTDGQTGATTKPGGQNWPWVKTNHFWWQTFLSVETWESETYKECTSFTFIYDSPYLSVT